MFFQALFQSPIIKNGLLDRGTVSGFGDKHDFGGDGGSQLSDDARGVKDLFPFPEEKGERDFSRQFPDLGGAVECAEALHPHMHRPSIHMEQPFQGGLINLGIEVFYLEDGLADDDSFRDEGPFHQIQ